MARDRTPLAIAIVAVLALTAHMVLGIVVGEDYALPVTIVGAIAAAVVLRGPVGQALARRLQGQSEPELPPEQVLNELEDLRTRVLELEERVDFSERLLAQTRANERAGG